MFQVPLLDVAGEAPDEVFGPCVASRKFSAAGARCQIRNLISIFD